MRKYKKDLKSFPSNIFRFRGQLDSREKYLRLDKNEKPSNLDFAILRHLKKNLRSFHITSYPELEKVYLNLAKYLSLKKENLVLTGGADLGIKNCFELFVRPNNKIITISPSFAMVDIYTKLFRAKPINFKYDKNLKIDLKKISKKIDKNIKMIILSNPNNPTGTIIRKKELLFLIKKAERFNVPFVVDEVYHGFSSETLIKYINKFKNLIIIRTFSKSYGLAALRAGYIISNKKIAQLLYKFKPMYEINSIAAIVINFLIKNSKFEKKNLNEFRSGKNYLISFLKKHKISFINTHTNFIHIRLKNKASSKYLMNYLFKKNILVRNGGPGVEGYENYLRVTTGSKKQMIYLTKILSTKWKFIK